MLIQSGSGNLYAVYATATGKPPDSLPDSVGTPYQLAIHPATIVLQTQSVFVGLRLRFARMDNGIFNPTVLSKWLLSLGFDRGKSTLRANVIYNTHIEIPGITKYFPENVATELADSGCAFHFCAGVFQDADVHPDFKEDFTKLLTSTVAGLYPPKDYSEVPTLTSPIDLSLFEAEVKGNSPGLKAVPTPPEASGDIIKPDFQGTSFDLKEMFDKPPKDPSA